MMTLSEFSTDQLIQTLQDSDTPLNPRFLQRLSDLDAHEGELVRQIWLILPNGRRLALMQDIEKLSAKNTLLDYYALCTIAIQDEDASVRLAAVRTLCEYDYVGIIKIFLNILETEKNTEVRTSAAKGLGRFILSGEIDELPAEKLEQIEDRLLILYTQDDDLSVRLAVLESLGYSSREEISTLIREAFASPDRNWKASALMAMGRSANQEWQPEVLSMFKSKYLLLQLEAARAAGELELQDAVSFLIEMLEDADDDLRRVCIWSLSQIGGEEASEALALLYDEAEDEEELEYIESAFENLSFTDGAKIMPLLKLPESEEAEDDEDYEDIDSLDDLFEEEEDDLD